MSGRSARTSGSSGAPSVGRARVALASGVVAAAAVTSAALFAPTAHAWPREFPRPSQQTWTWLEGHGGDRRFRVMAFDGHVHTNFSRDADHPPSMVLELADYVGLEMIVLTDHGSSSGAVAFPRHRGSVVPMIGEEVGGTFGHSVIYNVTNRRGVLEAARESMDALGTLVHERGGVVVLAHPGWWIDGNGVDPRRYMHPDALARGGIGQHIDALELWSQVYWRRSRALIDEWAALLDAHLYVPIVGNSDFHRMGGHDLGIPRNACLCPIDGAGALIGTPGECLLSAVREGRLYVTDGPTLDLSVAGHVLGEIVPALPHTWVEVSVRAQAPLGGTLRLFSGPDVTLELPLPAGELVERTLALPVGDRDTYVRAEIARLTPIEDRPPEFSLLSNPIRIDVLPLRTSWRGEERGTIPAPPGYRRIDVARAAARAEREAQRERARAHRASRAATP